MTTLVTKKFKQHLADQFIESLTEPANNVYYVVASKHTQYANNSDTPVPTPGDSIIEVVTNVYEEGIFGKKINASDVIMGVPKKIWASGTVYSQYDDQDVDIFTNDFYVAVDGGATYYVYKVLDNNRGANSTVDPAGIGGSTSESACNFITTADGYTWKLMYKVPEATFEKFATDDYMPVATSANVAGNTVSGAIDVIKIEYTGSNYVATLTGQFQADDVRETIPTMVGNTTTYRLNTSASSNNDFYVGSALYISSGAGSGQIRRIVDYNGSNRVAVVNTAFTVSPDSTSNYTIAPNIIVTGDGSNATAYATVSSNATVNNFISKINIVSRGSDFTYASATIAGNTGGVSNTATLRAIIPPPGGHGKNAPAELGSDSVLISISFTTNESGFVTVENDYRKLIILKDPLFNDVTLTMSGSVGTFIADETVFQYSYNTLVGTCAGNTTTTTITGSGTQFSSGLKQGDKVIITDNATGNKNIRTVSTITNSTQISVSANLSFVTSFATLAVANVIAQGLKSGNSTPYITLSNSEPKFVTGYGIIGQSSGAYANNITALTVGEKSYNNWNTFDNRTRIAYTAASGSVAEDTKMYQTDISLSNAFFHSANATYVFLTSERGPINADPAEILASNNNTGSFTLGSVKYNPDLSKNSGEVLYIENKSPISRSVSQSETIKLTVKF